MSDFAGAELFLSLLLRQAARTEDVMVRVYCEGAWHQFSGRDVAAHLGRAVEDLFKEFPALSERSSHSILFLVRNSYVSFIAPIAASLTGFDAVLVPAVANLDDIRSHLSMFNAIAIATDCLDSVEEIKSL